MLLWPRRLNSRGRNNSARRHSSDSTELEVRLPLGHFGLLMLLNQQARKGVTVLAWATDPNYPEFGLLLQNGGKDEYVRSTRDT